MPASIAGRKVILAASGAGMIDYGRNQFTFHVLEGLNARAQLLGIQIVTQSIADPPHDIGALEEVLGDNDVVGFFCF